MSKDLKGVLIPVSKNKSQQFENEQSILLMSMYRSFHSQNKSKKIMNVTPKRKIINTKVRNNSFQDSISNQLSTPHKSSQPLNSTYKQDFVPLNPAQQATLYLPKKRFIGYRANEKFFPQNLSDYYDLKIPKLNYYNNLQNDKTININTTQNGISILSQNGADDQYSQSQNFNENTYQNCKNNDQNNKILINNNALKNESQLANKEQIYINQDLQNEIQIENNQDYDMQNQNQLEEEENHSQKEKSQQEEQELYLQTQNNNIKQQQQAINGFINKSEIFQQNPQPYFFNSEFSQQNDYKNQNVMNNFADQESSDKQQQKQMENSQLRKSKYTSIKEKIAQQEDFIKKVRDFSSNVYDINSPKKQLNTNQFDESIFHKSLYQTDFNKNQLKNGEQKTKLKTIIEDQNITSGPMFYKKSLYRTNHINYKIEDNPNRVLNSSKYKQLVHIIPQLQSEKFSTYGESFKKFNDNKNLRLNLTTTNVKLPIDFSNIPFNSKSSYQMDFNSNKLKSSSNQFYSKEESQQMFPQRNESSIPTFPVYQNQKAIKEIYQKQHDKLFEKFLDKKESFQNLAQINQSVKN